MVAYPGHILESIKWIETYIDVNESKYRRQEDHTPFYLNYLSLFFFIKVVFFVMYWYK